MSSTCQHEWNAGFSPWAPQRCWKCARSVSLIVAVDSECGLGRNGLIPWRHHEDMQWFRQATSGGTLIVGRRTRDSLPAHGLPRRNIITVCSTMPIEQAYASALEQSNAVFFAGGVRVYDYALTVARDAYITRVHGTHDCDVHWPAAGRIDMMGFKLQRAEPLGRGLVLEHWSKS